MGILDGASTLTTAVSNTVSSIAPASGLSKVTDAVSGAFGSVGKFFKKLEGTKLPLPNPLHSYASYTYVLSLGCLTNDQLSNPDSTYMAGLNVPLICKTANGDPFNRVQTPYGKFDFFIEDLDLESQIGFMGGEVTNVTSLQFKVIEPYSMGMFPISLQKVAQDLKHQNFREAPYLLKIEFRGNTETGQMVKIPNTTRHIPFSIADIKMSVSEKGSIYTVSGMPWNQIALTDPFKNMTSDASIKGTTVQEMLQTGEKSLQTVLNQKLKDIATANKIQTPDEVIIIFPEDIASSSAGAAGASNKEDKATATTTTSNQASNGIFNKLGVARSTVNKTWVQPEGVCNALGKAKMGFSDARKGDAPIGKDNAIWDPETKLNIRANNSVNSAESDFKFKQDSDVPNAINQVLLNSEFITETFNSANLSPEGYRGWWRIDVQAYPLSEKVDPATGSVPKLIVYRVIPYSVHVSSGPMPPNVKPMGYANLKKQAVKEYNYIYTGKNVDVIQFNIDVNYGIAAELGTDTDQSQDIKTLAQTADAPDPVALGNPIGIGKEPSTKLGQMPTVVSHRNFLTRSDKAGGGGSENPGVRAARIFLDSITDGMDLVDLELKIIGDPYFIVQSGMGNYTSQKTQYANLNSDGTVDYQSGEVDIIVNFRTPVDINQATGLYNFNGMEKSAPVMAYSGLYQVTEAMSYFRNGQFTQVLKGMRRNLQEDPFESSPDTAYNLSANAEVDKTNIFGFGGA